MLEQFDKGRFNGGAECRRTPFIDPATGKDAIFLGLADERAWQRPDRSGFLVRTPGLSILFGAGSAIWDWAAACSMRR
ncbi:MAG: hypothetical protein NTW21_27175 [Verrucomicrobia bacterium]|nr:hypothetical protein [Verrucomicrobiota bacterium]